MTHHYTMKAADPVAQADLGAALQFIDSAERGALIDARRAEQNHRGRKSVIAAIDTRLRKLING